VTRTALSLRAAELVRAAQALPTAKSADTLYEMIVAGTAALRPGAVVSLHLVDGDSLRAVAVAPSRATHVGALAADHARRVLTAGSPLLIRGKRASERSYYGLPLADTEGALGVLGLSLPAGTTVPSGIERQLLDMYATQASLALRHSVLAATVERQATTLELAKGELFEAAKVLALGHLVSGVVHEVNNLLGTVTLRMERLLEAPPDPETARQLRALEGHCREIGDVIGELRRFSTAGGVGRVLVDLTALLERILRLRQARLRGDIRIERAYPSSGPSVMGDPGQIGRALLALVLEAENALLEVPGGGRLRVATAREERQDGAWAVVVVEDDGPAIPDHLLARMFEPFVARDGQGGRGPSVGLAAAHAIVETHGGRLSVANRTDRGVIYKVELPAG
jgi:C4-dicarboxylate-specific signal transduction histidine kinase